MNEPVKMPTFPIDPKIDGQGVVYRKDGTVSTPEPKPEEPKENEYGCDSDHSGS